MKAQSRTCTLALCGRLLRLSCVLTDPVRSYALCGGLLRLLSVGRRITLGDVGGPRAGAWSPDGQWIAFLRSQTGKVQLAKKGLPRVRVRKFSLMPLPSADGIGMIAPDGTRLRKLTSRKLHGFAFSRDGAQVYGIFPQQEENAGAGDLRLTEAEINRIDEAFPLGPPPRELPIL